MPPTSAFEPAAPFPPEVAGFAFGMAATDAVGACVNAGFQYVVNSADTFTCFGAPVDPFAGSRAVQVESCGGRVCGVMVHLGQTNTRLALTVLRMMRTRYGNEAQATGGKRTWYWGGPHPLNMRGWVSMSTEEGVTIITYYSPAALRKTVERFNRKLQNF